MEAYPQDLFFRFWHLDAKVGPNACPMKSTPHYQAAVEFLEGEVGSGFIKYAAYMSWAGKWDPSHNAEVYRKNFDMWAQDEFDLCNHPIAVFTRNNITYIVDGAHRCAFALAKNIERIPVVVREEPANWHWNQDVQRVESIESVVPLGNMGNMGSLR
jgi:hypothetical protein